MIAQDIRFSDRVPNGEHLMLRTSLDRRRRRFGRWSPTIWRILERRAARLNNSSSLVLGCILSLIRIN